METRIIKSKIKSIRSKGATWKALVQETAQAVALHVLEHGNVTLAADLLDAVSLNGGNYENLAKWLGEYAFVRMEKGVLSLNKSARKAALDPFGGRCDMARDAWTKEVEAGGMWYAEVEAERQQRTQKVFDSFKEADRLIERLLTKGDQQLAAKIKEVVEDYRKITTL